MSSNAPNAVPTVLPVEYPAAEGVDCMQLFSRIDIGFNLPPESARNVFQITNDNTQAVIATPKSQPSLSVVYRLEIDMNIPNTPPMSTARTVSCFWLTPRPV